VVNGDLQRRVANNNVSSNGIALNPSSQKDAIGVPDDFIVLDRVVSIGSSDQTDSEIITLSCISISACPVLTEPVMACASGQSYASAGSVQTAVAYRNVLGQLVQ